MTSRLKLKVLGSPQVMLRMARVEGRREAIGMRSGWSMGVEGLSAIVRILPPEMYDKITGGTGHEGHMMNHPKK